MGDQQQVSAGAVLIEDGRALTVLRERLADAGLTVRSVPAEGGHGAVQDGVSEALTALAGSGVSVLGVLAEGSGCDPAVRAAADEHRVRGIVLWAGDLSPDGVALLGEWPEAPLLSVVDKGDRSTLAQLASVAVAAEHEDSDLLVCAGAGGAESQGEETRRVQEAVADWLIDALAGVPTPTEVSFETADGWEISGSLTPPASEEPAPGVVLLHSGRTDRTVFARMVRLLAREGYAVLNIDWRGRGQSRGQGDYFDIPPEVRAAGGNDAAAALDLLAAQPGVDKERLGLIGIVHGAEYAVRGSVGDPRVRALALLTGYRPASAEERDYLTSGEVSVLYVTTEAHRPITEAMRELQGQTPDRQTQLIMYPGGAIGYQLFEIDRQLEPSIVGWLREVLGS